MEENTSRAIDLVIVLALTYFLYQILKLFITAIEIKDALLGIALILAFVIWNIVGKKIIKYIK